MKKLFLILTAATLPNLASAAATFFTFDGITSEGVFSTTGQNFGQTGVLSAYTVNVKGSFQPSSYSNPYTLSSSNLSGNPYENPVYGGAPGIFFRYLADQASGTNALVRFDVTFTRTGPGAYLKLDAFSAESVDREQDTLETSGSNWVLSDSENVDSVNLTGNTAVVTELNDQSGIGSYVLTTDFASGSGTVSWTYDYLAPPPVFTGGANMIGFAATVVPEPSTHAFVAIIGILGMAVRRRQKA